MDFALALIIHEIAAAVPESSLLTALPVLALLDVVPHFACWGLRWNALSARRFRRLATRPRELSEFRVRKAIAPCRLVTLGVLLCGQMLAQETKKKPGQSPRGPDYQVEVIDVSPVLGTGVAKDRVPANVQAIDGKEIDQGDGLSLTELFNQKVGSATVNDATTNPFQQNLRFRGFTASPLLGLPQGIAFYQNGVRINEPFGDVVQFDLLPDFAIDRLQILPGSHPVYGLNALGGAVGLQMKNGFSFQGVRAQAWGGSFGRYNVTGQYGGRSGAWAGYLGVARIAEDGWRDRSPSELTQVFADLAFRKERLDMGLSFTHAETDLNGGGLAPIELLASDRKAVFTFPDHTRNRLNFVQMRLNYGLTEQLSWQANVYYRHLDRDTLNGDEAEFEVCETEARPSGAPPGTLCEGGVGGAIVDLSSGAFVTQREARGDGVFNRTRTAGDGYGASLQSSYEGQWLGRENLFLVGYAGDFADTGFASNSEVGTLTSDRTVDPSGIFIGEHQEAPDDQFNTGLLSRSRSHGLYVSDTFSLSERIHLSLSGRYNSTNIRIFDQLGTDLNGDHSFRRFNPALGLTGRLTHHWTAFAGYSESNRSPTAVELSCADPEETCRVPNAFIADPPLDQVVSRTLEAGLRTRTPVSLKGVVMGGALAVFGSRNADDIIFVASPRLIGTGFFQNAGATQRLGLELGWEASYGDLVAYAHYSLVDATFQSDLSLPGDSQVNDAADENGRLKVRPGDRLPGVPRHNGKIGLAYTIRPRWSLALDSILASSQVFVGDEGNDQPALGGYGVVNLRSSYRVGDSLEVFLTIKNLFDRDYATFGALARLELELAEAPQAEDPRFQGPGAPRAAWVGFRIQF